MRINIKGVHRNGLIEFKFKTPEVWERLGWFEESVWEADYEQWDWKTGCWTRYPRPYTLQYALPGQTYIFREVGIKRCPDLEKFKSECFPAAFMQRMRQLIVGPAHEDSAVGEGSRRKRARSNDIEVSRPSKHRRIDPPSVSKGKGKAKAGPPPNAEIIDLVDEGVDEHDSDIEVLD